MKVSEIFVSNEERDILNTLDEPKEWDSFSERQQQVINNMVRKGVASKRKHGHGVYVYAVNPRT